MASNNQGKNQSGTSNRGFASMDSDRQREIASQGGRASHGGQGSSQSGRANASSGSNKSGSARGTQGGSSEQHAEAGRQSHKNDRK
jgi:uncharacterized protein